MKKLLSAFSILLLTTISDAQSIHFICFADTDDKKIGKGTAKDVTQMVDFVMTLASEIDMEDNLKPAIVMMGKDCNKANLISTIEEFTCSPEDIVMFYYSGHGARAYQDASEFPQMCLGSSSQKDFVSLEYVKRAIEKKGPRLSIVLGDCCNSYSTSITPKEVVVTTAAARSSYENNHEGLKKLFLETRGSIIAAGSRKGELSWGNPYNGGFFTHGFLNEIEDYTSSSGEAYDWQELMWRTRSRVIEDSRRALKSQGGYIQTPIYKIEFGKAAIRIKLEDGIHKALTTVADASISQNQRILQYKDILTTFFSSNNSMVDIVGKDMKTLVNYTTADNYLLRLATGERCSGFKIIEEKKDSNGKITYLKLNETH